MADAAMAMSSTPSGSGSPEAKFQLKLPKKISGSKKSPASDGQMLDELLSDIQALSKCAERIMHAKQGIGTEGDQPLSGTSSTVASTFANPEGSLPDQEPCNESGEAPEGMPDAAMLRDAYRMLLEAWEDRELAFHLEEQMKRSESEKVLLRQLEEKDRKTIELAAQLHKEKRRAAELESDLAAERRRNAQLLELASPNNKELRQGGDYPLFGPNCIQRLAAVETSLTSLKQLL
uniref:Uncharacterized protein n=1 Tax=Zooxanthella nutricula TaxID=1333877 RepID=A0A7S2H5E0_9DINO